MLNSETKRHIDAARDVLVGVAPNPTTQIDQITYALIYKFMDDMDQSAIKAGGKPSFFTGDLEPYAWSRFMDSRMGNQEKMNLYGEALTKFSEAKQLPELFRTIFRAAFLPYRSPETLGLFLKEISYFDYSHPEELGNAYEYLLSIMSSQGDAGQFRTPRHIIDFIVDVLNPTKDDKVLDPACGTAGFLVSTYNHILEQHDGKDDPKKKEKTLTPDERKKLMQNLQGYDIDPTMVRIAQVNMYLHQFKNPQIFQYDSLTSEERWNDKFDVILANPPFMTPKGGIKPHNKFGINVNRSEVLFIDYILSHLKPNGKAGIIVPEGIVFQSSSAYKNLRKNLVNNGLYAVISLPSGVFQPYSGVKTNILLIDKEFSKSNTKILFITLNQLGISLGISNKIIEENDLPFAHSIIDSFLKGTSIEPTKNIFSIEKKVIEEFDFTLSSSVYRPEKEGVGDAQWRKLSEICTIEKGKSSSTKTEPGPYPLVLTAKSFKSASQFDFDGEGVAVPLISSTGHGKADITRVHFVNGKFALANLLAFVQPISLNILNPKYLYYMLNSHKKELASLMNGAANVSMNTKDLGTFSIPLPPLEVQEQIVTELDGYAAIISGAKQIVENWKPAIDNSNNYELVELNQFCKIKNGYAFTSTDMGEFQDGSLPVVKIGNVGADGEIDTKFKFHTYSKKLDNFILVPGDIVIAMTGATVGKVATIPKGKFLLNQRVGKVEMTSTEVELDYVRFTLQSSTFYSYCQATATGGAQGNISAEEILKFKIPIAPMNVQLQLIEFVKKEKEQVESLRHLIESYETRSKSVISKLWSE